MRTLMALSLVALGIPAAHATPIRFDFSITLSGVEGTQPGAGTADGSGYVVFDTDLAAGASDTRVGDMNTPLPTIDLSFDWLGIHFDETNGTLGALYVDATGTINGWSIDGIVPPNLCAPAFQCVQWGTTDFNILAFGNGVGSGSALLTQAGVYGVAIGSVSWRTGSVPEPGTLAVMTLAFGGLALARRRRSRA